MQELWIEKQINKNIIKRIFKYYELGIMGCGRDSKPFLDLSEIVQLPNNKNEIFNELTDNLRRFTRGYNKTSCLIPKELNGGKHLISHYYNFIEQYVDQATLNKFSTQDEFDRFIIEKFDCRNWQNLLSPRITDFWYNKSLDTCKWLESNTTPIFREWAESLRSNVFDQIGRIIVFNSKVNEPVMMHRDFHYRTHTSHFINFQFSGKTNVAYVYDEVTRQKTYIDTPCYMFNECDIHGVDACDTPRFTVRIDGIFKPNICELLNLNNGNVWDENSKSFEKLKDLKIIESVFE
jgi:hypothetical protein